MADDEQTNDGTQQTTNGTEQADELAKARKEKDDAFRLLRDRDTKLRQNNERLSQIEQELREIKEARQQRAAETTSAVSADDPEPNIDEEPTKWLKWSRAKDLRDREVQQARMNAQSQATELNSFALSAEAAARTAHPDYDQAIGWLREDYRKELEESGELDEAAMSALNDPNQKQNIANYAMSHGLSDVDAAREICALGAFEWRRQQIVKASRRSGANPAIKAVEMAKRRGYKGEHHGAAGPQAFGKTASQVDASLAEMERKRNLKAAGQSLSETRGNEPHDKQVWTRAELEDLMKSNPAEYRRAIKEIAGRADEGNPKDVLADIITR